MADKIVGIVEPVDRSLDRVCPDQAAECFKRIADQYFVFSRAQNAFDAIGMLDSTENPQAFDGGML